MPSHEAHRCSCPHGHRCPPNLFPWQRIQNVGIQVVQRGPAHRIHLARKQDGKTGLTASSRKRLSSRKTGGDTDFRLLSSDLNPLTMGCHRHSKDRRELLALPCGARQEGGFPQASVPSCQHGSHPEVSGTPSGPRPHSPQWQGTNLTLKVYCDLLNPEAIFDLYAYHRLLTELEVTAS